MANNCYCQNDTVYTGKKESSYIIKYADNPTALDKNSNYIIEEISKSIPKILTYTQCSFDYNSKFYIIKSSKQSKGNKKIYSVSVSVTDGKTTGDILYKTFSIAEFLKPDLGSFSIIVKNISGNTSYTLPVSLMKLTNGAGTSVKISFQDSLPLPKFELTFNDISFHFSDSATAMVKRKLQLINDYYNSEFVIAKALEKLKNINLENVEMIKVYDITLKEVEAVITQLDNKDYIKKLGLTSNDPIDYTGKYKEVTQKVQNKRLMLNQMLYTLDKVYYQKGLEYLTNSDTTSALKFFEKSTVANPYYSPAFYQIAKIYFDQKKLDNAYPNITTITTTLSPDQALLKQTIQLGNNIYAAYLAKGEELIASEQNHKALEVLGNAKTFCSNTPAISCNEILQKDIAKAKYGIYNSFIIVSQKAVDKEIYYIAEIYTIKAKEYQKENSTDIISSAEADKLLGQLVKGYTAKGLSFNIQLRFDTALTLLEKAYGLCKAYPEIKCNDKLIAAISLAKNGTYRLMLKKAAEYIQSGNPEQAERKIAEAKIYQSSNTTEIPNSNAADSLTVLIKKLWYEKYISDGIKNLNMNEGMKALSSFSSARALEKEYAVKKDTLLDSLMIASARPYILDYIEVGCVRTWGNELEKAIIISDSSRILQKKYALENDTLILNALKDLDTKIKNQQCKNSQESCNEFYRLAFKSIAKKLYIEADAYFAQFIATTHKNSNCNIKDSLAILNKAKYNAAAVYQRKLHESDSLASISKYYDAINKYIECDSYYNSHDMSVFGITHLTIKDYLSSRKDNNYIYKCATYYLDKADISETFYYLEILRKKYYPEENTSDLQNKIAVKLANTDFAANPKSKPLTLINNYTGNNTWYKNFKKTYLLTWKELKKKK